LIIFEEIYHSPFFTPKPPKGGLKKIIKEILKTIEVLEPPLGGRGKQQGM
jgi:hypothetical protein